MNQSDAIFIQGNPLREIRTRMQQHTRHAVYGVDDALMIASLAATAAGTGISMAGQQESADAMARARGNFQQKQQRLQEDANKVFANSKNLATRTTSDETLAKGANQRGQIVKALQQASVPTATALPSNSATGYQVSDPGAAAAQAAGNATRTANTTAATNLAAYDDWNTQNQLNAAEAARNMTPISSKSQGNARIFPTLLEAASHKGDNLSQWGQVVGALGSVAGGLGSLVSAPATAAAAAPSGALAMNASNQAFNSGLWSTLAAGGVPSSSNWLGTAARSLWSTLR